MLLTQDRPLPQRRRNFPCPQFPSRWITLPITDKSIILLNIRRHDLNQPPINIKLMISSDQDGLAKLPKLRVPPRLTPINESRKSALARFTGDEDVLEMQIRVGESDAGVVGQ